MTKTKSRLKTLLVILLSVMVTLAYSVPAFAADGDSSDSSAETKLAAGEYLVQATVTIGATNMMTGEAMDDDSAQELVEGSTRTSQYTITKTGDRTFKVEANDLGKAMRAFENVDQDKYTAASYEKAKALYDEYDQTADDDFDAAKITDSAKALNDAVSALAEKADEAETTQLTDAITAAKAVKNDNYTDASWKAFQDAITAAENAAKDLAKGDAAAQIKAISDAQAKLVKVTSATVSGITYKVAGKTAQVVKASKSIKKASIKSTVKIGSKTYKVTSIKAKAFKGKKKLTTVTISKNIKTIGASAFQSDKKLKTVTIGKSVKTIGAKAFYGDKKLKKITFKGKAVKKIGSKAFKAPKAKKKAYKKMIRKAGATKGFKVK